MYLVHRCDRPDLQNTDLLNHFVEMAGKHSSHCKIECRIADLPHRLSVTAFHEKSYFEP